MLLKAYDDAKLTRRGYLARKIHKVPGRVRLAIMRVRLCFTVKSERQVLTKLTDRELMDIGISRADADTESRKAFLDVPINRLDAQAINNGD